jgi:uncharacterized low-complexity protein
MKKRLEWQFQGCQLLPANLYTGSVSRTPEGGSQGVSVLRYSASSACGETSCGVSKALSNGVPYVGYLRSLYTGSNSQTPEGFQGVSVLCQLLSANLYTGSVSRTPEGYQGVPVLRYSAERDCGETSCGTSKALSNGVQYVGYLPSSGGSIGLYACRGSVIREKGSNAAVGTLALVCATLLDEEGVSVAPLSHSFWTISHFSVVSHNVFASASGVFPSLLTAFTFLASVLSILSTT